MEDKGCILNLNSKKENILFKILTVRIYPTCLVKFIDINKGTNLLAYFQSGLEKIRHDLVEGEYYIKLKPKAMKLTFHRLTNEKPPFRLEFEGARSIKLDPAHTLLFLYFLRKKGNPTYLSNVKK